MERGGGGGEKGGRGEVEAADSAGERKEGTVEVDGEHIQPNLVGGMIEVQRLPVCRESPSRISKKWHDIPCLLCTYPVKGHTPQGSAAPRPVQTSCLPAHATREAHGSHPSRRPNRARGKAPETSTITDA